MYTENEFEISNKSYTNKDFESIYPELLELVTKLTDKWDPSTSNESDPGVILIKLAAIIADKLNYNVDKNVLETFPLSVTQRSNAHKLYDMLGYSMRWYRAATTKVAVTFTGDSSDCPVKLDKWTMFTNDSGDLVYTLLEPLTLPERGTLVEGQVIQGTIQDYEVNGVYDITLDNLDENNRVYFKERLVAENGVYITNKGVGETDEYWERVQNLESAQLSSKIFKFGVLPGTETCYVQFPQDIGNLIGSGLRIKYIVTDGAAGNIKANVLTSLYQEVTYADGKDLSSSVVIKNTTSTSNGSDPEDIDSAYHNYKRTIGTFDTLVTLRDYENAIYLLENELGQPNVSNVVVSDRTCDINNTTNVVTLTQNGVEKVNEVVVSPDGDVSMTAFDLGLYVLNDPGTVVNEYYYNRSFSVHNNIDDIQQLIQDKASVNHDYINTYGVTPQRFLFKNFYKLNGKVLTYYKVTKVQAQEIEQNIKIALYKRFNARNVNFGEPVDYDTIVDTIRSADTRIKSVILAEPEYELRELISSDVYGRYNTSRSLVDNTEIGTTDSPLLVLLAKMVLGGNVQLYKFDNDIAFRFGQTELEKYSGVSSITTTCSITPKSAGSITESDHEAIVYTGEDNTVGYEIPEGVNIQLTAPNFYVDKSYTAYVNYELLKTSSGIKPTVTKSDTEFTFEYESTSYALSMELVSEDYLLMLRSNGDVLTSASVSSAVNVNDTWKMILSHQNVKFVVTFVVNTSAAVHVLQSVQVEVVTPFQVSQNQYYTLSDDERIFINYTDSNQNVQNEFIEPGSTIKFTDNSDPSAVLSRTKSTIVKTYDSVVYNVSTLTSSQQIDVVKLNETRFDTTRVVNCLWFTNTSSEVERDGIVQTEYILFDKGQTERLLEDNEYFIYTDESKNDLIILGSGTLIRRQHSSSYDPEYNKVISYLANVLQSSVVSEGASAIGDTDWFAYKTSNNNVLILQELQSVTLGAKAGFRCSGFVGAQNVVNNTRCPVLNPEYCEDFTVQNPSWVTLPTFHDANVHWSVRSKLNVTMGPNYPQTVTTTVGTTTSKVFTVVTDKRVASFQGELRLIASNGATWSTPLKRKASTDVYYFIVNQTEYSFNRNDVDTVNGSFKFNKTLANEVAVEGFRCRIDNNDYEVILLDTDVVYYDEKGSSVSTSADIQNKSLLSNAILAFTGGEDRDVTSSTDNDINVYAYTNVALPSVEAGNNIHEELEYNNDEEIRITYDFYNQFVCHEFHETLVTGEKPYISLPFSYKGVVTDATSTYASVKKKLLIPITFNCSYTNVKVSAYNHLGNTTTSYTAAYSPLTTSPSGYSKASVQYIEFDQTETNKFKELRVTWEPNLDEFSSFELDSSASTTQFEKNLQAWSPVGGDTTTREQFTFVKNGNSYDVYRVSSVESTLVLGQKLHTASKNEVFHLIVNNNVYGYYMIHTGTDNKDRLYIVSKNDFILVGSIHLIDSNTPYSDQVTKTLQRLANNYALSQNEVTQKFEQLLQEYPEFDISYSVPITDMIDTSSANESDRDYLFSSVAVWDKNHICNKYTIPQLVTDTQYFSLKVSETSIKM